MRDKCKACTDEYYKGMIKDVTNNYGHDVKFCPMCGRCLEKPDYHRIEPVHIKDRSNTPMDDVEESHPSFAQLSFHRYNGGHKNLYGSAIQHQEYIALQIKRSVKHTSPYSEHYYAHSAPLIEVFMSQAQFAEAITTMNMGSGVPVTLHSLKGEFFPLCPEFNQAQKANGVLRQKMKDFGSKIKEGQIRTAEILNKKGAINKSERKELNNIYSSVRQDLESNLPFLHECMTEAFDKTTMSAKADIEAFYVNAVNRLGLEAIETNKTELISNDDFVEAEIVE